jgi:hypothetical protein
LDEEIDAEKGIPAFGFGLRRSSKKKISGVEKKDVLPFLSDLGDESGFLGDTAKRGSESPAGLDLAHHVVCIDDAELILALGLGERVLVKQ